MFMRAIGSTLILSGVVAAAIALAQNPDKASDGNSQPPTVEIPMPDGAVIQPLPSTQVYAFQSVPGVYSVPAAPPRPVSPEEQKQAAEFLKAVGELRRADTPEAKTAARERVAEMVGAQLERDLQVREKKLSEIEARAKELRDQLEQRRSSKAEIQKMLMLLIESPESGFGLPPEWMGSLMTPSATGPGYNKYTPLYQAGPSYPYPAGVRPTLPPAPKPTLPENSSR